jgi:hypothetical protein
LWVEHQRIEGTMLVIQPTADGRLRIFNNHRSDFARDESSARTLAYNWGHTDISINKALSEMRSATRGDAQPSGWRVARQEPPRKSVPAKAPEPPAADAAPKPAARVETPAPVAERRPRPRKAAAPKPAPNTVLAPVKPVAAEPKAPPKTRAKPAAVAKPPRAAPVKAPAKVAKPVKAVAKAPVKAAEKRPMKAEPKPPAAKGDPRDRALAHLRAGVRELAGIEDATLAFARGPWSELREMAEYIAACLEGKKPKTGWEKK